VSEETSGRGISDAFDVGGLLGSIDSASLAELMSIWRARVPEEGSGSPALFRCLGERILAHGEPLLAYDVVTAGLMTWPNDVRLRQLQGLALARSGATERANAMLEALANRDQTDEETLGMLGRTYKDLAARADNPMRRDEFLKRAAKTYETAYVQTGGYWTGINAATMSLLINDEKHACQIAEKVREQCLKEIEDPTGDQYWELAALGEAALICRDWSQAKEWYKRAANLAKNRFGDLSSSRRNARLILRYWDHDAAWLDHCLPVPSVVVFAGHMIDRPARSVPRFPRDLEKPVAKQIRERIDRLRPGFGFASAACGSDILFLEAMLDIGAEISVVLPYNEEEFVRDSVDIIAKSKWRARFNHVLARAARVITASTQKLEIGGVSYEFCNDMLLGLASMRARQLDAALIPLAVWNEKQGDGPGGASSAVENWRTLGYVPEIINVEKVYDESSQLRGTRDGPVGNDEGWDKGNDNEAATRRFASKIVAILFADAVGFSKLTEREVPRFVQHFLGAIAQLSRTFSASIIANNTWGDGLYFIFSDVGAGGDFALQLADLVMKTNWEEKGLRPETNLRIALHAGPVYEFNDPITGQRSYSGTHVSRAARIEPITPPGQVYASEAFAALAAAQRTRTFSCDYVGQTPMAKGYGTLPVYHLRRNVARAHL
jgi:class 3 adenylate cyclase